MQALEDRSRQLARWLALVGLCGLLLLAAMTTLDVLLRWLFGLPIHGVNDVSSIVMAVVVSACIPANLALKQNITVEVIGATAGPTVRRWLDLFASCLTLIFIVLVAWQFIPFSAGLRETGEQTWVLRWPVWPWWSFAAFFLVLAAVAQFIVTLADIRAALTGGGAKTDDTLPGAGIDGSR